MELFDELIECLKSGNEVRFWVEASLAENKIYLVCCLRKNGKDIDAFNLIEVNSVTHENLADTLKTLREG